MKNLSPVSCNNTQLLNQIISSKKEPNKSLILGVLDHLRSSYELYEASINNLESLSNTAWNDDVKTALHTCFDSTYLKKIKATILANSPTTCQYCGISSIKPLDHYLPKEIYPEYSVLVLNLIPACSDCNTKKGVFWINSNRERQFINFYYDPVTTAQQFLYCEILESNRIIKARYKLDLTDFSNRSFANIINAHFDNLNLLDRYGQSIDDVISEAIYGSVNAYKRTTLELNEISLRIKQKLIDDSSSKANLSGTNNWKAVLFDSLSSSNLFIDKCLEEIAVFRSFPS